MEENTKTLDRFKKARDLGIVIPCDHPTLGDDSCHSSSKKLEIRLVLDEFETLVYYHTNGRRMVAKRKLPLEKDSLINPFCPSCRLFLAKTFLASNKNKMIDFAWFNKRLDALSDEIWKKVEFLKQQEEGMEHELKPVRVYDRRLSSTAPNLRVCNEEEFEALVRLDPKTRVYEEEIPIFKGLEMISIDNDDDNVLLKREDTCGICLQKLKITDIKEGESEDLEVGNITTKWSKSLGKLPCKHVFHEPCVLRWLHKNHVCPFCRDPIN